MTVNTKARVKLLRGIGENGNSHVRNGIVIGEMSRYQVRRRRDHLLYQPSRGVSSSLG